MTLDSNIVIAYLSGDQKVADALMFWKENGKTIFLPAVVEAEVLSFPNFTIGEKQRTEEFLESLNFVPLDRPISRLSAGVRRVTGMKFPDAAIAATALATHTPIVTRNIKDFNKITGLTVVTI